jgi:CO dehydrogenase maturation factor
MSKPVILAFCGKGGVGKTSISAISTRLLHETYPDKRILAIDADPAIGLATALGVDSSSTVDDIRKLFIENAESGDTKAALEILSEAKYQMFDALVEIDNISFLAIGRPEASGCYCKVNAYLKEVINLLAGNFDYVIIDGEAGIEQVNRRVMEKVTHLILVSDASRKGIEVTKTIKKVAEELVMYETCGLILNRVNASVDVNRLDIGSLDLLGVIPDDKEMMLSDVEGNSVFSLDKESNIMKETKLALKKIGIL